jgi:hypothetical protein
VVQHLTERLALADRSVRRLRHAPIATGSRGSTLIEPNFPSPSRFRPRVAYASRSRSPHSVFLSALCFEELVDELGECRRVAAARRRDLAAAKCLNRHACRATRKRRSLMGTQTPLADRRSRRGSAPASRTCRGEQNCRAGDVAVHRHRGRYTYGGYRRVGDVHLLSCPSTQGRVDERDDSAGRSRAAK